MKSSDTTQQLATEFPSFSETMQGVDNSFSWSAVEQLRKQSSMPPLPPSAQLHCDDYDFSSLQLQAMGGGETEVGVALEDRVEGLVPGSSQVSWLLLQGWGSAGDRDESGLCVLGKYCQEGNNVGDAVGLAALVARGMGLPLPLVGGEVQTATSSSNGSSAVRNHQMSMPRSWASLLGPPLSLSSSSMF